MAFYATKFKQLIDQLPFLEKQTAKKSGLGTAFTLTADPSTISAIYQDNGYTRSAVSRRMVNHMGAADALVAQTNERAQVKRPALIKHLDSTTYKQIELSAWQRIDKVLAMGEQQLDFYELLRDSLQKSSIEHLLGVELTDNLVDLIESAGIQDIYQHKYQVSLAKLFILNYVPLPSFVKNLLSPELKEKNSKFHDVASTIYANARGKPKSWFNQLKEMEANGVLTHDEVLGEIRSVFVGAHTLSISLVWTVHLLATEDQTHSNSVLDLAYARNVYMESLRLYPPFYILSYEKKSKCPFHFGKESVVVSTAQAHRSPLNWDNADKFDPARFSKGMSGIKKGSYVPFGGGERSCPGAALSMSVAPKLLQRLYSKYKVLDVEHLVAKRRVELTPENSTFIVKIAPL